MAKLEKKFGKYLVELDNSSNDEFPTQCHITHVTRAKREYVASLACAQDTGELNNSLCGSIKIEQAIIDEIEQWALENGY
jgi:hypothetical protein